MNYIVFWKHKLPEDRQPLTHTTRYRLLLSDINPNGVLYQTYEHKIVYDAASNLQAKVSSVIQNKEWCWCPARSEDMVEIQSKLSLI